MKFTNLVSGKEVVDFKAGDILILKDRRTGEEVVYMIARCYNMYNLINLHNGIMFSDRFKPFEDIQKGIRMWYDIIGVIENEHLELSMLGGVQMMVDAEEVIKDLKEQLKKQKEDICKYQEEIKKLERENISLLETSLSSVYGIDFEPCESGGLDDVRNKYQYVEYDNITYPIPKKLYKICHTEGYRAGFIEGIKGRV